jgi:hypothetical protein
VDLEGKVKIGIKALVALLLAVATGIVAVSSQWAALATKTDLEGLLHRHSEQPDAHPAMAKALQDQTSRVVTLDARTARLEEKSNEAKETMDYIRSRVDFLTEQSVRQAVADRLPAPQARQAGERAVQRLRAGEPPLDAVSE